MVLCEKDNLHPHNYSAFKIIERFSKHFFNKTEEKQLEKWHAINYVEVRNYARELFDEHTVLLKEKGRDTVEGII